MKPEPNGAPNAATVIPFPLEKTTTSNAQIDAMMYAAFVQMDAVYNWALYASEDAARSDCADKAADAMVAILDAWEARKAIETG